LIPAIVKIGCQPFALRHGIQFRDYECHFDNEADAQMRSPTFTADPPLAMALIGSEMPATFGPFPATGYRPQLNPQLRQGHRSGPA
jgi:hypothetical protein